ncbi:MAG: ribose 5-phosphate isomerase B [Deltaproteobacteria bacterium RIFOXYA12_FULL_61_11]|nr:MAG: ribose 5-phosphate isomerase B [Deltaproteobacteria bacterium RIFOXYA12_FULL_61_11]
MKVFLGSDHRGFPLKRALHEHLLHKGVFCEDLGCPGTEAADYPQYAAAVARAVVATPGTRGILVCGSGLGMSIAANRWKGIRAALVHDVLSAKRSRQHNDANVLVLGGDFVAEALAIELLTTWLETPFEGARHQRRLERIDREE